MEGWGGNSIGKALEVGGYRSDFTLSTHMENSTRHSASVVLALGRWGRRLLGAHWSASLATLESFRFNERLYLKKEDG